MLNYEEYIIHHLINDKDFFSKAFTSIKPNYFQDEIAKKVFTKLRKIITDENRKNIPSEADLFAFLSKECNEKSYKELKDFMERTTNIETSKNQDILVDDAEKWVMLESTRASLEKSIELFETRNSDELVKIKAIFDENAKVSFRKTIGMSLMETIEERFDNYKEEELIKTYFPPIDNLLMGGMAKEFLLLFLAPTNVGKCNSSKSLITIKHNKTGEIKEMTIGNFHKMIKNDNEL